MKTIRSFAGLITIKTFVILALSCLATWLCLQFDILADLPTGLIGIALVFPIVFAINSAYRRREEALGHYASLKGQLMALYYASRDWAGETGDTETLGQKLRDLASELLSGIRDYLDGSTDREAQFGKIYRIFSGFSKHSEKLREAGIPANEVSRANQYVRGMMIDFEKLRNIADYRTPIALRAYSTIFLTTFPILFAPHFAHISKNSSGFLASGFLVAAAYSVVLVSLDNVEEELEDPFDGVGADDIDLDLAGKYEAVMKD